MTFADSMTLPDMLCRTVQHYGRQPAILEGNQTYSWQSFKERIAKTANMLLNKGLAKGDRFAVCARNSRAFEELKWGGHWIGAVPVPVNWRLAPPEIAHLLQDSECALAFVESDFLAAFSSDALIEWSGELVLIDGDLESLCTQAKPVERCESDPDDDALILYTGGTTGRSKGVRISHTNILSNALAFGLGVGARPGDVYLHAAPMFHSADLLGMAWMMNGSAHCYLPNFSPANWLGAISSYKVSATVAVPAMLMAMLPDPAFETADISSLRLLMYGASPMPLPWIRRTAEAFPGIDFLNCYGLTEVAPDLTLFDPREFRAAIESGDEDGPIRSVGKPNLLNEIRIAGPDGETLDQGAVGEIWARGPNIMNGYLNLPETTADALQDGWFRTGDIGRIDEEGYVYLLDRLKDLVITGGENVYTSEVEAALASHPGVSEVAVVGVPDPKMTEALLAVVDPASDPPPSAEELIAHCRPLIGGYKIPRRYEFVETFPRSALGKILKAELRTRFGE